jgi:hypothetical protein
MGVRKTSLLPGTRAMYRTSGSLALIDELRASIGGFDASSATDARESAVTADSMFNDEENFTK